MKVRDFYFAYDYDRKNNDATELCRFMGGTFERFDKKQKKWIVDKELYRIFIGEDIFYDEILEKEANKLVEKWCGNDAIQSVKGCGKSSQ